MPCQAETETDAPDYLASPASHTLTVSPPETRRLPSALKLTLQNGSMRPLRERSSWPFSTSHTLIELSQLAEAKRLPSALKLTLLIWPGCPLREGISLPA